MILLPSNTYFDYTSPVMHFEAGFLHYTNYVKQAGHKQPEWWLWKGLVEIVPY